MGRAATNTKEKLLETAIELIWQNSYGRVSVDEICKSAGVQKGSFYHYFPSKMDLTLSALDHSSEKSEPIFDAIFDSAIPPRERFFKLCDFGYNHQKETQKKYGRVCGCPFMSLGSEMAGQEDAITKKINDVIQKHQARNQKVIEEMIFLGELSKNINAKEKAKQIHAYVMGCIMMARIQNNLAPLRDNLKNGILNILGLEQKSIENV